MQQTYKIEEKALPFKTQCSREKRNQEAIQHSILLGLLTQFYTITLEKPTKKSNVTEQIPKIMTIVINGETFDYDSFVKERFISEINHPFETPQERVKSLRMYNRNVHIFTNNFLFDLCVETGFLFHSHLSKLSKNNQRIEYFDSVFYNKKVVIDSKNIPVLGKSLCKHFAHLLDSLETTKTVTIHAGDAAVAEIIGFNYSDCNQQNIQSTTPNENVHDGICSLSGSNSFVNLSSPVKVDC